MSSKLDDYRKEINQIDEALYELYKKRLNVSRQVGAYKKEHGIAILDEKREQLIASSIHEKYETDIDLNAYLDLHETMMRVSRNAQYTFAPCVYNVVDSLKMDCTVGYQGVVGSFSSNATKTLFPKNDKKPYDTFLKVFEAVVNGEITYGVVPLENSGQGEIVEVLDLLCNLDVAIVAEVIQPKSNKTIATIASKEVTSENRLDSLNANIENNRTRFIVIAKEPEFLSTAKKTSILVTVDHKIEKLAQVVAQFRYEKIKMVKIISRPIANVESRYQFFIDFEGGVCEESVQHLLQRLQAEVYEMRLLGSYPVFESH